jgi:hypothetical protein
MISTSQVDLNAGLIEHIHHNNVTDRTFTISRQSGLNGRGNRLQFDVHTVDRPDLRHSTERHGMTRRKDLYWHGALAFRTRLLIN